MILNSWPTITSNFLKQKIILNLKIIQQIIS